MAVKTFTSGEILTASDTNAYLANALHVYVGGSTFTNQASVTYSNVFTSAFNQYKIVWYINSTAATSTDLRAQLTIAGTPTGAGYVAGMRMFNTGLGTATVDYGQTLTTAFLLGNPGEPNYQAASGEGMITYPASSTMRKGFHAVGGGLASSVAYLGNWCAGTLGNTAAHDGIKIFAGVNNITGGVAIYGVRYP